jgi:hypothetical protein
MTNTATTKDITAMFHRLPVVRSLVRTARPESIQLAAELSDYRTEADRNDLNALLDEYPDTEAEPIRDLLNRQMVAA